MIKTLDDKRCDALAWILSNPKARNRRAQFIAKTRRSHVMHLVGVDENEKSTK